MAKLTRSVSVLFAFLAIAHPAGAANRDECEFIREGLKALPTAGGEFVVPAGRYVCATAVVLDRDNLSLRGEGKVILRLADNANAPLVIMGEINTPPRNIKNVQVSDLELDGNMAHQQIECWGGPCDSGGTAFIRNNSLTVRGITDGKIRNVIARSARSGGVVTERGCYNLEIDGLTAVENYFDGFAGYQTHGARLRRMDLSNNRAAGISIDIDFSGNLIENTRVANNGDVGIFMRDSNSNKFLNVTISGSGNHGIFLSQVTDLNTCANDNEFENLKISGSRGFGFRLNNACKGNSLTGVAEFAKNRDGCVSQPPLARLEVRGQLRCQK